MSESSAQHAGEQPGDVIGRYKLLEQIGEGGMGTIWMAEQREPVKRRVALKIIKLGMDTKQVIARFEAERQALAMMDHPHIAKVLDAGATNTGRPYFVMEYIKGIPILEYCDKERLDTTARLQLFTSVCHAIQHAHQKGIIHRDIKPSNVLVTLHDGVPVPKVIDFGIAKATNHELTTKTLFTEHRQMIGTPAYMSPEQAEMSGLDIDTRSDIYALGVLLYELLTGTTPFDAKRLLESGYHEMLRAIREDEPHKPSTRISSLGDTGTRTASQRKIDLKKLSTLLRGDLDWIVMKCLEKDRSRRYDTANGLAADIGRHLRDEPVTAGAPSVGYKARKFAKRNRAQVIAGATVTAVLVLGVIGTSGGMVWANSERERAENEKTRATLAAAAEAKARVEAQANAERAVAEQARAEAAQAEEAGARKRAETISEFVITALRSSDAENQGGSQDMTILAAMDNAVADIDSGRFEDDPAVEAHLRVTIGAILRNNGRLRDAEIVLTRALETVRRLDDPHLAITANELAMVKSHLGRKAEAKELFVEALELDRRHFRGDHAAVSRGLTNLASVLPPAEAEPLLVQALEMDRRLHQGDHTDIAADLANLASKRLEMGRAVEAEPLFAESLEMARRLYRGDHPVLAKSLDNLGKTRYALGRRAEAVELLRQTVAMQKRLFKGPHPDVATGLNNLAGLLMEEGRPEEAAPLYAEALEMRQHVFAGDNKEVAMSFSTVAGALLAQGRPAEAEPYFTRGLEMRRRLAPDDNPDVADSLFRLADVFLEMRRPTEARAYCEQALEMNRRLHPGDDTAVMQSLIQLGSVLAAENRVADALAPLAEAQAMLRRLAPGDTPAAAIVLDNLGKAFQSAGRLDDAETFLEDALAMRERIFEGDHADVAKGLNNLSGAIAARGRFDEAAALQQRSLEMYQRLFGIDSPQLAFALNVRAVLYRDAGRAAEAEPYSTKAVETYRRIFEGDNPNLALACFNLGTIREALGRLRESVKSFEEANAMIRRLLPATSPSVLHSTTRLATAYYGVGRSDEAIPLLEQALKDEVLVFGREHPDTLMTIGNLGANYAKVRRYAEAAPLLEEVRPYAQQYPQLGFVHMHLLDAYVHLADTAKAKALADEIVAESRATSPSGSPQLAQSLVSVGLMLLDLGDWDAAERLLREGLAIREKTQPDAWTTFNTQSLLGGALLGRKQYADAEPLLLAGYRGMKEREATIPGNGNTRIPDALERLVRLYEATGDATVAATWRRELEATTKSGKR